MSWNSNYAGNAHLGHATARARADADAAAEKAAAQKALERDRVNRRTAEQSSSSSSWVTPPPKTIPSYLTSGPLPPVDSAGRLRPSLPVTPPAEVLYPHDQNLAEFYAIRHPEIYMLHLNHRNHPITGEKVLEIMWDDTLPHGREFIPLAVLNKNWSGVRSQGVTLPLEIRRDGASFALRWLPPPSQSPPIRTPSPGELKVMLGLPGADKKATFNLLPSSTSGSPVTDSGSTIPDVIAKAAAVALISAAGTAVVWWRNRQGRSN